MTGRLFPVDGSYTGGEAVSAAWPSVKAHSAVALSVWILSRHGAEGRRETSSTSPENQLENQQETNRQANLRDKCNPPPQFLFCSLYFDPLGTAASGN